MISDPKQAYDRLRQRVMAVAGRQRGCSLIEGGGRLLWTVGGGLLVAVLLERLIGLPLLLRALVLPAAGIAFLWLGWRFVLRVLLARYNVSRAAMLVEIARPDLASRVISALQLYPELESGCRGFEAELVRAVVLYGENSTAAQDFRQVIDPRPAKRQAKFALAALLTWGILVALSPVGMGAALRRMVGAWSEIQDLAQRAAGARIVVADFDREAFLRGADIIIRLRQQGFHRERMTLFLRPLGGEDWADHELAVAPDGGAAYLMAKALKSFELYARSGRIESERVTVIVTEAPRIVKLSVEYDLPAYVRRAPVVQPRSDGNLKVLLGSSVVLTVETNKPLKSLVLAGSFLKEPLSFNVGGKFAQGVLRLDDEKWLEDKRPRIEETYRLKLTDEYGYTNRNAERVYRLTINKDQAPKLQFVGLPHRSSASEPHILEDRLDGVPLAVRGADDYGLTSITLHYRIEDLETGREKDKGRKKFPLGMPRTDVRRLALTRLSELGATVGDRIVFWAEGEDAYDLEPQEGPHKVRTPSYKVAVVTEEELFEEIAYSDDWSAQWYDSLKVASLARRAPPPRLAPESEPSAKVARKLLEALPLNESYPGEDGRTIRSYFESLGGIE